MQFSKSKSGYKIIYYYDDDKKEQFWFQKKMEAIEFFYDNSNLIFEDFDNLNEIFLFVVENNVNFHCFSLFDNLKVDLNGHILSFDYRF